MAQKSIGITRNLGAIRLDGQPANLKDFYRLVEHVSNTYKVSLSVVRYRLLESGLVRSSNRDLGYESTGRLLENFLEKLFTEERPRE